METSILPQIDPKSITIKEVWKDNLEKEFGLIRDTIKEFPYVGMDTEFPATAVNIPGNSKFQNMKSNVNGSKLIRLGFALSDEKGNLPPIPGTNKYCAWQFNFCEFDPSKDPHNQYTVNLLSGGCGFEVVKNNREGIKGENFGALLMSSGVVLTDNVYWVTFDGANNFGYLLKMLRGENLPDTETEFFKLLDSFFPVVYDVKHLMKFCDGLYGELNDVAKQVGVERIGIGQQAGSDSLLTSWTFLKLKKMWFNGSIDQSYEGVLDGLDRPLRTGTN